MIMVSTYQLAFFNGDLHSYRRWRFLAADFCTRCYLTIGNLVQLKIQTEDVREIDKLMWLLLNQVSPLTGGVRLEQEYNQWGLCDILSEFIHIIRWEIGRREVEVFEHIDFSLTGLEKVGVD